MDREFSEARLRKAKLTKKWITHYYKKDKPNPTKNHPKVV
jgi:hypothetical protein